MADDRDKIAVPACLCPENAEIVLVIMEGDALYKARSTSWVEGSGCGFICVGAVGALSL